MASRGEYLNSKLLAAYLGVSFIDATQMILFHTDGSFDVEASNTTIARKLANVERAVIPGFYGMVPNSSASVMAVPVMPESLSYRRK